MIGDISSQGSSLVSEERSLVLHLILTTFAGEEIQLSIELQELDRLNEFENAVLENLAFLVSAMSIHESLLLFPTDLYIPWPPRLHDDAICQPRLPLTAYQTYRELRQFD